MKKQDTFYYSDPVNDDFAGTKIVKKQIDDKFRYYHNGIFYKLKKFIVYRVIVSAVAKFYLTFCARVKYVNKKALKPYKKGPCFIYGNHTGYFCDAFNPTKLSFPREAYVVVNSDATSIFGLKNLLLDVGALPIPEDFHYMGKFNDAMKRAVERRGWISIYPEAHIWPWYTGIRPFLDVSFRYPIQYDAPCFSYTMTYQKKKVGKKPKRVVYIDGPFFGDKSLPKKQAEKKLRDEVYDAMCESAKHSNQDYFKYIYRPKEENKDEDPV